MVIIQRIKNALKKIDLKDTFDFKTPKMELFEDDFLRDIENILNNNPNNIIKEMTPKGPVFTVYDFLAEHSRQSRLNGMFYRVGPDFVSIQGYDVTHQAKVGFVDTAFNVAQQRYLDKFKPHGKERSAY
ncbi:MAG: hypothetical protein LBF37_02940 [Rickettsiales bacterium]|jgi:hypothetical protein|nr:hypothetical protein [Rickettsiales bacterium]